MSVYSDCCFVLLSFAVVVNKDMCVYSMALTQYYKIAEFNVDWKAI